MARLPALIFLLCLPFAGGAVTAAPPSELTTVAEVRALGGAGEFVEHPVRLRGVVLLKLAVDPTSGLDAFMFADGSASIYVASLPGRFPGLKRGDLLEVRGLASPGDFAPIVFASGVTAQGTGAIPPPSAVTFDQLATGRFDGQYVEISGIVRSSRKTASPDSRALAELSTGGGRLVVNSQDSQAQSLPVDSEVTVTGIVFQQFSRTGQAIHPFLTVPYGVPIVITRPPPGDVPLRRIDRLMAFSSEGALGHRVRIRGVVTHHQLGESLWLEEDGHGIRVHLHDSAAYTAGEAVEVAGFAVQGNYSPEMEDASVLRLALADPPRPAVLKTSAEALEHDGGLITLEGKLIEEMRVPLGFRLVLRDAERDFVAHLRTDGETPGPAWEIGSRVRISAICSVSKIPPSDTPGTVVPRDFELILRSPADVQVIEVPPWWNAERRSWLLAGIVVVLVLVVIGVVRAARRRLRLSSASRRQAETEFAAILAERNRIAREIHDTLAQGLGAISVHLEMVRDYVPAGTKAAVHLAEARNLTRESLTEARTSIWNMRSQALETGDCSDAIAGVLDRLTDLDGIEGHFSVAGEPFRLSPVTENNLLRIAQEAITNAVKHARATRIEVRLVFTGDEIHLEVSDNGCGFDPSVPAPADSHFGLVGMRERAAETHGTLTIESGRGKRTLVSFVLPVSAAAHNHS
jgi:signal transduction histidine kinase